MKLGIDTSTYFEELEHGAKYYDGGREIEPLGAFRKNGVDVMRIRVWVDPYSEKGEPYGAGTCDTDNFIKLASLAQDKGYKILINFHYSDFWVDPSKQQLPKAWQGLDLSGLCDKVYEYTAESLDRVKAAGIELCGIQIGNEITNGMLWPIGKLGEPGPDGVRTGYGNLIALLKSAITACRERYSLADIIIHLERSYDKETYCEYFDQLEKAGVDYDAIGMSYYQFWHGNFKSYFENVDFLIKRYAKKIMTVETGYPFTFEDYEKDANGINRLMINNYEELSTNYAADFPFTREGQRRYLHDFLEHAEAHGIDTVFWWEPLWLPLPGIGWATEAAEVYSGDEGKPTRNEWANQCLFDYEGKKLPAFDEFKKRGPRS